MTKFRDITLLFQILTYNSLPPHFTTFPPYCQVKEWLNFTFLKFQSQALDTLSNLHIRPQISSFSNFYIISKFKKAGISWKLEIPESWKLKKAGFPFRNPAWFSHLQVS
jgi:hypothetical protein